jgi:hypothetical protein
MQNGIHFNVGVYQMNNTQIKNIIELCLVRLIVGFCLFSLLFLAIAYTVEYNTGISISVVIPLCLALIAAIVEVKEIGVNCYCK